MTFDEILDQANEMLQRKQRRSYWAIKRQFDIDDDYREDLKEERISSKRVAMDESA